MTRSADTAGREWAFDPDWITLNNGSFGACPASVRAVQAGFAAEFERQPTAFLHHAMPPMLRQAAATLAGHLGAAAGDVAFVSNATAGVNAVLRSLALAPGDEILVLDHAYGAVRRTVDFVARKAGAIVVEVAVPFPETHEAAVVAQVAAGMTDRTVLAVLDHITSPTALVLPIGAMVAACHARGVRVLVDGAHAPGQLPLDLEAIGADWYAANLHKWLFAPVGTAFLHARPEAQRDLHPPSISHGLDHGFTAEFDWTGTQDFSGWLAVPAAIAFHERLGGRALMRRNADLAGQGAALLADALGMSRGATRPYGCLEGCAMALVDVPRGFGDTFEAAMALRARLIDARIDVPVSCVGGVLRFRVSAQAYNTLADFERLAARLRIVLASS